MSKFVKMALLPALITIPSMVDAQNSNSLHIHTNTPIELKPVSTNLGKQYASVCFLGEGDCGGGGFSKGDEDMVIDTARQCIDHGYDKTSCPLPSYLSDQCPYDELYYAKCIDDKGRACKDLGFILTCGTGEIEDLRCPYDNSYKKCKCNPCSGYSYSLSEVSGQGYVSDGSCQSCTVMKYKRKENPCSGYSTCECGGEIGASVCYTGSVKKFANCKSCTPPLPSCAIGFIYYSDNTCSMDVVGGKVPLGVVVYMKPDGTGGQALAKTSVGDYYWGSGYNVDTLPDIKDWKVAQKDFNSCSNTNTILAFGKLRGYSFPSAEKAKGYAPTAETRGKWCLPAAGILSSWYVNRSSIDVGMGKIGGVQVGSSHIHNCSSSEYSVNSSWVFCVGSGLQGGLDYGSATNGNGIHNVRPVIEFKL